MFDFLIGCRTASFLVLSHYNHLKNMSLMGMEDSPEFDKCIDKLKHCVSVENKEYEKVSAEDIDTYLKKAKEHDIIDQIDARSYLKINERKKVLDGHRLIGDNLLLSQVIASKLYIDILKDADLKVNSLSENEVLDYEDIEMIKNYHISYKYYYLSSNRYLEQIAIDNKFDIQKIQSYTFEDIENIYDIKFTDKLQNVIYDYIVSAIDELANLETEDKYLLLYKSILNVARVKATLPYLDVDSLNKVMELYKDNKYSYDSNGALRKVKKLVKKRKEELSE